MVNALSLDNIKLPSGGFKKTGLCVTTNVLFWSHGWRVFRCPTYAEFAFYCIFLPCPMVSHGAPGPLTELQPGHRWWAPVRKEEGVKLCVSTRHVDVIQLPLRSRHFPSKGSIYNIQKQSKSTPAVMVWWLQGTTLTYEHPLWPRWVDLSKLICSHLILVWLFSVTIPLFL